MRFNDTMREGCAGGRWTARGGWKPHTNSIRARRRRLIEAAGGIRQFKKQMRMARYARAAAGVIKTAAA